ncbi:MAG: hypothetical protein ABF743_07180 [Schleiferilactobacillus perolens]|jgi:outer membrane murein-binding lipoprotein Lpp|nr:hypothetical protein [Schleiferilactobacillus perolens]
METVNSVVKIMVVGTLIVGTVLIAGTVFSAKLIDRAGDKLQQNIHN